jgi:hypothetical protein
MLLDELALVDYCAGVSFYAPQLAPKERAIEMKVTKALATGTAALAFAAPALAATATLTATPAQADPVQSRVLQNPNV